MTIPATTSDDSNPDSFGTSDERERSFESDDEATRRLNSSDVPSFSGDESEGSTQTSEPQDAMTDGSTTEQFGNFDATDDVWKEPSDVQIRISSEESAQYAAGSTFVSERYQPDADASKPGENKGGTDDGDVLKPGERFGQFTVVRFVGGGGMGRVYEGVDNELERKVAIKVLPRRRAQDEAVVARFLNEARSAARLNHENIAQVYLSGNVDGVPYIAFEYVDGTNLRDYVRERGVLELNEAIDFVLQAADALAHAALHGVTHRDVKPSNIIITPQKRAKLIDMGLARLLKNDADDDLTESGVTLGTFDYISPEQARDPRLADVRSDVYSLGCTFYYMLVGAPPFPEGTMLQKLLQHQGDEAPDVRAANPKTPVEIASVIKKMMRKNPDERYQTPEALIADLREISELLGIRVSDADVAESAAKVRTPSRRWRRFLPGLVSIVLLLAYVAGVYLFDRSEAELPDVDVAWNALETPQNGTDKPEAGEPDGKKTNAETQTEPRQSAATNESPSVEIATTDKTNVGENASGGGVAGGAAELDALYASAALSVGVDDSSTLENAVSSESDPSAAARRLAFCWNASREDQGASIVLCAGLAQDSESNVVRSCALRSFGARDVKDRAQETQGDASLFVVDGIGSAPNSFATLRAALDASASRDSEETTRVELRFNGSISVAPMTLVDRRIEIRAGEGFRPSLSFQPTESSSDVRDERFLYMTSSSALIDGVFISFVVPKGRTGAGYAIFETSDASNLTIRNSCLTFNGVPDDSTAPPVSTSSSFFALTNAVKAENDQNSTEDGGTKEDVVATVRLENALVRGEASLARIERTGARIEAENCLFNLSGDFFRYVASRRDAPDKPGFSIRCDHIFATCGSSFVQIDAANAKDFLPSFKVDVANSIVRLPNRPFAFVASTTPLPEENFWSEWNFKAISLMDATTFCRFSLTRDDSIKDYPSPFEKSVCETISLGGEAREANKRWESVAPSRLVPSEFVAPTLKPLDESADVLPTTRENAKTIREFVDALVARFPDDLTKK